MAVDPLIVMFYIEHQVVPISGPPRPDGGDFGFGGWGGGGTRARGVCLLSLLLGGCKMVWREVLISPADPDSQSETHAG